MRRVALLTCLAVLALAGCSQSTLAEDDQTFCAEQDDDFAELRGELEQLIDGDRHWSSDGEPYGYGRAYVDPAVNSLRAFEAQDAELASRVTAARDRLVRLQSKLNEDSSVSGDGTATWADDGGPLKDAAQGLRLLGEFCDDNA